MRDDTWQHVGDVARRMVDRMERERRSKYSEAEKAELLESAKRASAELGSMKLSAETQALLRQEP